MAHILGKLERRRLVEVLDHHAVGVVRHDPEQLAGPAEHQVAPRRVKLAEQALDGVVVHLHVERRAQINLEGAFPVIALLRPHQHRVLKLVGIRRGAISHAAQLPGFRSRERQKHQARIQLVE